MTTVSSNLVSMSMNMGHRVCKTFGIHPKKTRLDSFQPDKRNRSWIGSRETPPRATSRLDSRETIGRNMLHVTQLGGMTVELALVMPGAIVIKGRHDLLCSL